MTPVSCCYRPVGRVNAVKMITMNTLSAATKEIATTSSFLEVLQNTGHVARNSIYRVVLLMVGSGSAVEITWQ